MQEDDKDKSILDKTLWERQHEAYQREDEKGNFIRDDDPPAPKEPDDKSGE